MVWDQASGIALVPMSCGRSVAVGRPALVSAGAPLLRASSESSVKASKPAGAVAGGSVAPGFAATAARCGDLGAPARRTATRHSKPPPGTVPARRSVRGSAVIAEPVSAPTVIRRTGSRTISSTQVNARAPESLRAPSAPWISAATFPRSRITVPSSVGATTPNGGGSDPLPNTTAASRWAIAAPG